MIRTKSKQAFWDFPMRQSVGRWVGFGYWYPGSPLGNGLLFRTVETVIPPTLSVTYGLMAAMAFEAEQEVTL